MKHSEFIAELERIIDKHMDPTAYTPPMEMGGFEDYFAGETTKLQRENQKLRERNEFLESTDLPVVVKENDELRTRLRNSEAQLGEANLQIAILQGKIRNQETSVNEVGHLIAELAKVRAEEEGLRITLNRIVSMGTEELDG